MPVVGIIVGVIVEGVRYVSNWLFGTNPVSSPAWPASVVGTGRNELHVKLKRFDDMHRSRCDSRKCSRVKNGVRLIMENLKSLMDRNRISQFFIDNLVRCGSMVNGTKLGAPDEMDFAFECTISGQEGATGDSDEDEDEDDLVTPLITKLLQIIRQQNRERSYPLFDSQDRQTGHILDLIQTERRCFTGKCNDIFNNQELPSGWQYGGYNSPGYSGLRCNGPALMSQFICNDLERPVNVNVDIVLALSVALPENESTYCLQEDRFKFLARAGHLTKLWFIPTKTTVKVSYAPAENSWLEVFELNAPVKRVIRILKILNCVSLPRSLDVNKDTIATNAMKPIYSVLLSVRERIRRLQHAEYTELNIVDIYNDNTLLRQINEIYPDLHFFPSYVFQTLVLLLFALCSKAQPSVAMVDLWREHDIPFIVETVLDIMFTCLEANQDLSDSYINARRQMKLKVTLKGRGGTLVECVSFDAIGLVCNKAFSNSSLMAHVLSMKSKLRQVAGPRGDEPLYAQRNNRRKITRRSREYFVRIDYHCALLEELQCMASN